ncbi:penicillin-binding protein [Nitrincola tapanii]|jgi:hypothetical protein|uniref:Penicillin-binding protein n=1 Tax=Nitrincola tapanii TaxID=1708751 RepID=A0A5A9W0T3_9GAMM|nr:penicillin-binding protein [Nitrincola tapanii]KAA0874172.1 penicillin-binding protein [Nitrincola tapanii]
MSSSLPPDILQALKIAFTYMPHPMDVTRYEYGDEFERIQSDIQQVREALLQLEIDPDEVMGEIRPDSTPNSCY